MTNHPKFTASHDSAARRPDDDAKRCKHVDYEPIRFTAELGVLVGGYDQCRNDAWPGKKFCYLHRDK